MPTSPSQRLTRTVARLLLLAVVACGERTPTDPAPSMGDPLVVARDEARRTGRELLLSIRGHQDVHVSDEIERREAVARVLGSGAEFGVVTMTMEVEVDFAAGREPEALSAPDWLNALCLPFPIVGRSNDEPCVLKFHRLLPLYVLADTDFRPIALLWEEELAAVATARVALETARAKRRLRDGEFALAEFLDDRERASALQRGLSALDPWLITRCYAAELELLVEHGDDAVRSWASPLLHEHRLLRACFELWRAMGDLRTISPWRLSEQLAPVVRRHTDLPEVAMLAACIRGSADLRLALDDDDRDRICERVAEATARCGPPWHGVGKTWLFMAREPR